ncbi:hypothetical protein Tco_1262627 [Tanacetum coccineum]|uniref:Uncharacterized protein n=1 Tax=Tanacetum coccineum TaxID=301880 RepID=A0ABQ5EBV6_9ASTR
METTTITTSLPEITPFIALQLRVARLEQEMSEVKKTDHLLIFISRNNLCCLAQSLSKSRIQKRSSRRSIKAKRNNIRREQDSTYSIRSQLIKLNLEEFDRKSALFQSHEIRRSLPTKTRPTTAIHSSHGTLIADETPWIMEVADKVKEPQEKAR